jgi:cell division protein FtsX
MAEVQLLKQIVADLSFLKQKVIYMEEELNEISKGLYELRPSYVKKLKKIDKGRFFSREEFEKELKE